MNRTHGRQIERAKKLRQEYLGKKAGAALFGAAMAAIALVIGVAALVLISAVVQNIGFSITNMAFFAFLVALTSAAAVYVSRISSASFKEARTLTYVPPVREKIADLPDDEILLRGTDRPVAAPGDLLRAAREGSETGSEVLLRPTKSV